MPCSVAAIRIWLATYQSIPRLIDEQLAAHGGNSVYARGEGDARDDLDGQFDSWFAAMAPVAMKHFGVDGNLARSADDAPLYAIEPVAASAANSPVSQGGVVPMKVLENRELQNRVGDNKRSTRHIEVHLPIGMSYRVGDHLSVIPRNDPVLVDAVARRFGFLPADQIRLNVAQGRRAQLPVGDVVSVGRLLSEFVELQAIATRKQIQIMAEHTRCPMTKPKLLGLISDDDSYRAQDFGEAHIGVRPARRASGLRIAVPRVSGNAVAVGPALLFDLVVTTGKHRGRCAAVQRDIGPWSKARRIPGAALTKACARTSSPAAARVIRSMPSCAKPRPASGCRTIPPCR